LLQREGNVAHLAMETVSMFPAPIAEATPPIPSAPEPTHAELPDQDHRVAGDGLAEDLSPVDERDRWQSESVVTHQVDEVELGEQRWSSAPILPPVEEAAVTIAPTTVAAPIEEAADVAPAVQDESIADASLQDDVRSEDESAPEEPPRVPSEPDYTPSRPLLSTGLEKEGDDSIMAQLLGHHAPEASAAAPTQDNALDTVSSAGSVASIEHAAPEDPEAPLQTANVAPTEKKTRVRRGAADVASTAATSRARRVVAPVVAKEPPALKSKPATPGRRGRPPTAATAKKPATAKKIAAATPARRGRPPKSAVAEKPATKTTKKAGPKATATITATGKKRGRPSAADIAARTPTKPAAKKTAAKTTATKATNTAGPGKGKGKRGASTTLSKAAKPDQARR
jgi:hypothetical protein